MPHPELPNRESWPEGPNVENLVHVLNTMLTLCNYLTAEAVMAKSEGEITAIEEDIIFQGIKATDDTLRSTLAWLRW